MSRTKKHVNPDPLTGEPGSHPIGTSLGTIAAASVGAMIGSAIGPVGTISGAVVGAILGGMGGGFAGSDIAELVNPTDAGLEDKWRKHHFDSFDSKYQPYEKYRDAYKYGRHAYVRYPDKKFNEIESDLASEWNMNNGGLILEWQYARDAVQHAYENSGVNTTLVK